MKQTYDYDDLLAELQAGKISMVEFVEKQEQFSDEWEQWLTDHPRTDESAEEFIDFLESIAE